MGKVEKRNGVYYIDPEWTMPTYEKIMDDVNEYLGVKAYLDTWPQFYANLHLFDAGKVISEKDETELIAFQRESKSALSKLYAAAAERPELVNGLNLLLVDRMKFAESFAAKENQPLDPWFKKLVVVFKDLQYFLITLMHDEQDNELHDKLWSSADFWDMIKRFGGGDKLLKDHLERLVLAPDKAIFIQRQLDALRSSLKTNSMEHHLYDHATGSRVSVAFGEYRRLGVAWVEGGYNRSMDDLKMHTEGSVDLNARVPAAKHKYVHNHMLLAMAEGGALAFHLAFLKSELAKVNRGEEPTYVSTPSGNETPDIHAVVEKYLAPFKEAFLSDADFVDAKKRVKAFFGGRMDVSDRVIKVKRGYVKTLGRALTEIYITQADQAISYGFLRYMQSLFSIYQKLELPETQFNKSTLYKYFTEKRKPPNTLL